MLSDKIQTALNTQINVEFSSAYEYLALSACFESLSLKGFAHWMRVQYQEERVHAIKIYDFIHARNGRVALQRIEAPHAACNSPLEAFTRAYENEKKVSAKIDALVELAATERDHATYAFLQWFVNEQVEEERITYEIAQKLELLGDAQSALFLMDRELAGRAADKDEAED
ncbi:MAG: ferritin [Candidatus Latescibacteria bacterium]|nr:ferritin [Candidatus Latescibacterota bacterium]